MLIPRLTNATAASTAGIGAEYAKQAKNCRANSGSIKGKQRRRKKDCGDKRDQCHIAADADRSIDARRPASQGAAIGYGPFEGAAPAGEQDVSRIPTALLFHCRRLGPGLLCSEHRGPGDVAFRSVRAARQIFDRAAVERARWEIHGFEAAVGRKDCVDEAQLLEQLLPVDVGNQAQTGNDVANGNIRGALLAMHIAHRYLRRRVLNRQTLVEPCQRGGDDRILIAQPMNELDRECPRKRPPILRREYEGGGLGRSAPRAKQTVGEPIRHLPLGAARGNLLREASEILNQNDAECDRYRPELTDSERLHFLIGRNKANQHLGVETAISMSNEGPGDAEHSRIANERPVGEFGELTIIAGRQVRANLIDLLFHEMIIIDEPFCRGRYRAAIIDRLYGGTICARADRLDCRRDGRQKAVPYPLAKTQSAQPRGCGHGPRGAQR